MLLKHRFFAFLFSLSFTPFLFSQSPPDLTADIPWDENAVTAGNQQTYANKTAIDNAFTNARRKEEVQFGIATNTLGSLVLPTNYLTLTQDQQALLLVNAERACRAGVNYSGTVVKGLPLEAIEGTIDGVSQAHMDWMIANNKWSHTGAGGLSPFQRIDNAVGTSCREFITYGENLAIFGSSSGVPPLLVAQSMYIWIFADASSSWGHRQMCLYQGFNNNRNSASSEGYLGWASGGKNDGTYNPVGFNLAFQYATVMNYFDPVATGCSFVVPVELLTFDAKGQQDGIGLTWSTASEVHFKGFEIERSEDGTHFFTMNYMPSQAKTKNEKTDYTFLDPSVKPHLVYFYRLRLVDDDGQFENSPVRSAILRGDKVGINDFRLSSNITKGALSIENLAYEAHEWTVQMFDISGKLIVSEKVNISAGARSDVSLPSAILSGLYLVRVGDNTFSKTQKLVVTN